MRGIFCCLALCLLCGCARHSEDDIRTIVGQWLWIGETLAFSATSDCTAAQFAAELPMVKSAAPLEQNLDYGLNRLERDPVVAFLVPSLTATQVSERIATRKWALGLTLVNSGIAARSCMDDAFTAGFVAALNSRDTILIFDRAGPSLTLLDRRAGMVFHTRGSV